MGTTLSFDMRYSSKLGSVLIPEQVNQLKIKNHNTITVTYPLDKDMGLIVPYIIQEGVKASLVDLSQRLGISYIDTLNHCKDSRYDLYYELSDITYFCRHYYKETQQGVKSHVLLYMPLEVEGKQLKVMDVTYMFPLEVRNLLNEKYLPYVKNKIR